MDSRRSRRQPPTRYNWLPVLEKPGAHGRIFGRNRRRRLLGNLSRVLERHGWVVLQATTNYNSLRDISECPICLYWHRTRTFDFLRSLNVVLIFIQIGVTVGEAENPRRNIPKGLHVMTYPGVPTHQGSQPYGGVCQGDCARE